MISRTHTDFIIRGIDPEFHSRLIAKNDEELTRLGIRSYTADSKPGYPCRLSLKDAEVGEEVLLLTFEHHAVNSPYRSSGPIFIRKDASATSLEVNQVPKMLYHRLLSLRVYNQESMMIDARTLKGNRLEHEIRDIFNDPEASYIHVHNASPGCYNCTVERA